VPASTNAPPALRAEVNQQRSRLAAIEIPASVDAASLPVHADVPPGRDGVQAAHSQLIGD